MAEVKWIKITTDIFDDEKIKIIDTMPARDEILVIWFKLLALSGKTNHSGMLFMSNKIPYTPEMLSAVFNRELNVVKLALSTFTSFGMIEIEENEIICISNWDKHQNIDGLEKIRLQTNERVKRNREKKKQLLLNDCNATCNVTVTQCNDVELELDKKSKKEKKEKKEFIPPTLQDVIDYCNERENGVDAKRFYDSYAVADWIDSKGEPVKNWKQKIINVWENNANKTQQQNQRSTSHIKPASSIERNDVKWV